MTLKRPWVIESIPYPKQPKCLPDIPERELVLKFLDGIPNLKHRAILTTCYGAGVRISEATHLKVSDINSARMILQVHQGKRKKDRIVPLSEALLRLLREYWRVVGDSSSRRWIQTFAHDTTGRLTDSYSVKACTSYTDSTHTVTTNTTAGQRFQFAFDSNSALSTVKLRDPANGNLNSS